MSTYLESITTEYHRYKKLAEGAIRQVDDADLTTALDPEGNSISVIVQHISGNLKSRFTDFLTSDGEKAWRDRDREFIEKALVRVELLNLWEDGCAVLFDALRTLSSNDLDKEVLIRGEALSVPEALNRSLAHVAYHVGQIVLLARMSAKGRWQYLSIPKGQSAAYNQNPTLEKVPHQPIQPPL
jgi:hypothetical protein